MNYLEQINPPNPAIQPIGAVGQAFLKQGITSLWEAIDFVHQLPYGRTTDRANYCQVLSEQRGACSSKHALIAALAEEQGVPLQLTMGVFLLTAKNRPEISPILEAYSLDSIPEAHCYLTYKNHKLDITFPESSEFSFQAHLEQETQITPQQIGSFKVEQHQAFIKEWVKNKPELSFDLVWAAREQWIHALSHQKT